MSVLGAETFSTHLRRSEFPAFLRGWFAAARELRAANALMHEAFVAKVRAEGPRSAARMAERIEKVMREATARIAPRSGAPEARGRGRSPSKTSRIPTAPRGVSHASVTPAFIRAAEAVHQG